MISVLFTVSYLVELHLLIDISYYSFCILALVFQAYASFLPEFNTQKHNILFLSSCDPVFRFFLKPE